MAYLEDAQKAHATPLQSQDESDRTATSFRESDSTAAGAKQSFAEKLSTRAHGSPKLVAQIPATPVQSSGSRLKKEALKRESAGASTSQKKVGNRTLRTLSAAPASALESLNGVGNGTNSDSSLPSFAGMGNGGSLWHAEVAERKVRASVFVSLLSKSGTTAARL